MTRNSATVPALQHRFPAEHRLQTGARAARSAGLLALILAGCSSDPGVGDLQSPTSHAGTNSAGGAAGASGSTAMTGGGSPAGGSANPSGGSFSSSGTTGSPAGGTAGASGGGAAGAAGAIASAGAGGGRPSGPSTGCGKDLSGTDVLGSATLRMLDVTGMAAQYSAGYTHRKYCTTLPKNYDNKQSYPVVFYGPGCGATACEGNGFSGRSDIIVVQAIASADAKGDNLVPKNGAPGCFQAGKESTNDSPEGPYFDQVMSVVEGAYCVDKGKIYAAGTSSGAWLSNYLACARGNVVRAAAADSGGLQFNHGTCTGGAAVMEFPGDSTDAKDQEGNQIGSAAARDLFIKTNGCSTTPIPMSFDKASNCQVYGGCDSPIAWCNVGGGHQSGNSYLSPAGSAFWSTLK